MTGWRMAQAWKAIPFCKVDLAVHNFQNGKALTQDKNMYLVYVLLFMLTHLINPKGVL